MTWAEGVLGPLRLTPVRNRPWASVWRAESAGGLWWLKVRGPTAGYEPRLPTLLGRWSPDLVPRVLVHPEEPRRPAGALRALLEPGDWLRPTSPPSSTTPTGGWSLVWAVR